jgi:hypothetical protein
MKNTILILILGILAYTGKAQTNTTKIRVDYAFEHGDTTRSFSIFSNDLDKCREKLITLWDKPKHNTTGIITWTNIKMEGIGNDVTINLCDGVVVKDKKEMYHKVFESDADKAEKLKDKQNNQGRMITITVCDKNSKNIIISKTLTTVVEKLLDSVLL